jgi:TolB-like protein/DNA-binding winged helix-turn-helix (wHTH) protein/Flp pilus assembly protein TadD
LDISTGDKAVLGFGPFLLDTIRRRLTLNGDMVKLAPTQFDTLLYLVQNPGRVVEKDELLTAVWGGRIIEESNLSQAIYLLRRALATGGSGDNFIVTAPGRGYRFSAEVRRVFEPEPAHEIDIRPDTAFGEKAHTTAQGAPVVRAEKRRPGSRLLVATCVVVLIMAGLGEAFLRRNAAVMLERPSPDEAVFHPPAHSVAVLAFTNMSGDAEQDYFSDGLSEELIDSLGRLEGVRVPGRLSSFSFKGREVSIADIARRLNVATVLEGSVRRDGTRVRITARLVDAVSGYLLWSAHFDRDQGDILKVQEEIAAAVTTSLRLTLIDREPAKLQLGGTSNPEAFDAYLRGRKFQSVNDEDSNHDKEAIAAFDQALAMDPHFALAEAMRARALADRSLWDAGAGGFVKLSEAAIAGATRATALAPDLGAAHGALAFALGNAHHYEAAQAEYDLALRLSPNDPSVKMAYAFFQVDTGHLQRSVEVAREAVALDPLTARTYSDLAWCLYLARHYDEALEVISHAQQLAPGGKTFASGEAGFIHLMKGEPERARDDCAAARDWIQLGCLAMAEHKLNNPEGATKALATLRAAVGDGGAYNYAQIYAQWGQTGEVCKWLNTAYRLHDSGLHLLKVDPMLDPVRDTPEFKEVKKRLNFPP